MDLPGIWLGISPDSGLGRAARPELRGHVRGPQGMARL